MASNNQYDILIVRQKYTPYGGAERFVSRALDSLVKRGLSVAVMSRRWADDTPYSALVCNPFYLGRLWRDASFAKAVCQKLANYKTIVQSHERIVCCDIYRAGDGVHREWLKQRARSRPPLLRWLEQISPYHRYVKQAEKRLFESDRLKWVICNSHMVAEELKLWFGLADSKIRVIHSGVDTEAFYPGLNKHREEIKERYNIGSFSQIMLFVGSGFERKGLRSAIIALSKTTGLVLLVVGKDSSQWRFKRLAQHYGVEKRVIFAGPQQDVRHFYGAADAFVLPTLYDPFPNVVLEAMACGLPVMTSSKSGAVDIIEKGRNGYLCDALDVDTLALQMMALQEDDRLKQKLGDAARQTVLNMTLDNMAEQYSALYEEVLSKD